MNKKKKNHRPSPSMIIHGKSDIYDNLITELLEKGYDVRIIEKLEDVLEVYREVENIISRPTALFLDVFKDSEINFHFFIEDLYIELIKIIDRNFQGKSLRQILGIIRGEELEQNG